MRAFALSVTRVWRLLLCAAVPALAVTPARAQVGESLLLPPLVPPGYNRGRNVSVLELSRKAYDSVGIRVGSFTLSPSIRSAGGVTSNTYYTANPVASTFISTVPSALLVSNWSRHQLSISGSGAFRDYLGQTRRNESTWQSDVRGRIDLGRFSSVTLEENSSQQNENEFTGEVTPTVAALSRYRRDYFSIRGTNQVGRMRTTLAVDYATFRFAPLPLLSGVVADQTYRNRSISRFTGQLEYATSPSVALFVQAGYALQRYQTDLAPGVPNVDTDYYRVIGGVNFDEAGTMRGSLGIGYNYQKPKFAQYRAGGGLALAGKLEIFPTRLTTVTINVSRSLGVTALGVNGSYTDNRVSARVDREVWHSLLVNASASFSRQSYSLAAAGARAYTLGIGARYLSSRRIVVDGSLGYQDRRADSILIGNSFDELRGEIGLTFKI